MKKLLLITCGLAIAAVVEAQIIHVPGDYPTIQQGIDAANTGDTVLVDPGTYLENIYLNKNITLSSLYLTTLDTSFISQTIIDGCHISHVINIVFPVDTNCFITGFTITNGYTEYLGAGIICSGASPVLSYLVIKNNHAEYGYMSYDGDGGGIGCGIYSITPGGYTYSFPRIRHVEISGNTSDGAGGGLYAGGGHTYMEDVTFHDNSGGWNGGAIYIAIGDVGGLSMKNIKVFNNISYGSIIHLLFLG